MLLRKVVGVRRGKILFLCVVHLVIGKHGSFTRLKDALFGVAVEVRVTRRLLPVAMRCVLLWAKPDFLLRNDWIQEARLLLHLLPKYDTFLKLCARWMIVKL